MIEIPPAVLDALQPRLLIWPVLFGLGAYLLLTAQPIGRPKPDLAERLQRLDADERIRLDRERERNAARHIFAWRQLEGFLRPVLDDLGRLSRRLLGRFGLAGGPDLERRLGIARPGVEPAQFFGEKLAAGLIGFVIFPLMNGIGVHPFGSWPVWIWLAGVACGFLAPDWDLTRRLLARRTACLLEMPAMLDLLTIAASAGLALEQALTVVAQQSNGVIAQELRRATREVTLGQQTLGEALEGVAERNAVPELTSVIGQLRAAHEQGMPLVQTLSTQAEGLRERKRLRIVAEGEKAAVRMILPVALFILPVIFVVLLVPAGLELVRLGG